MRRLRTTLAIDENNPPKDDDIFKGNGCGRELGRYAEVKEALVKLAKAAVDRIVEAAFGKKPLGMADRSSRVTASWRICGFPPIRYGTSIEPN
ncbi:MAG: hypothetical protein E5V56_00230 [Mesorhizobium sp.]|nr:MAG: hypothetical protein E5V56_00230 [Mesorhizobium sp.]